MLGTRRWKELVGLMNSVLRSIYFVILFFSSVALEVVRLIVKIMPIKKRACAVSVAAHALLE